MTARAAAVSEAMSALGMPLQRRTSAHGHARGQEWSRTKAVTIRANSSGRARGHQWPSSTSTRVRSRQRASRPATDARCDPEVAGRHDEQHRHRGAPGQRMPQARDHVGAVEVDAVLGVVPQLLAPGQQVGGRVEPADHRARPAAADAARRARGARGSGRARRTSCAAPEAAAAAGRSTTRPRLPRWSRDGPLLEVYDARRPSSRGSHVSAATTSQPAIEPQSCATRCTCSPGREGRVEHGDQVLDQQGGAVRRTARRAASTVPNRARRR